MRDIYSSPRMDNIERVVALMAQHGIQTRIQNRRAYHGSDWKRFSYTAKADRSSWPIVAVVKSEDQTKARQLLRDAGLEPATRFAEDLAAWGGVGSASAHRRASKRVRLIVLALIAAVAVLIGLRVFTG